MKNIRKLLFITIPICLVTVLCIFNDIHQLIGTWVMLFTQNSTQSLQGYIMRSTFPFGITMFLSFFQTAFLPWYPPRIDMAAAVCLGKIMGLLAVVLGSLLAWSFWFILVKLVFPQGIRKMQKPLHVSTGLIVLGITLLYPDVLPLIAAAAVLLRGSFVASGVGALAAVSIRAFLYIHYCSLFTSYLPNAVNNTAKIAGIMITLLGMIHARRKKYSHVQ